MNIFRLSDDPHLAAIYQCDKHVVKMVLESAQLLESAAAFHLLPTTYKTTHINHPCTVWARTDRANYEWLIDHAMHLSAEYTWRYRKTHACDVIIKNCTRYVSSIPEGPGTEPPQCMPDEFRGKNAVEAYRRYYKYKQTKISMKWATGARSMPAWLEVL